jgi:hypothetical protein
LIRARRSRKLWNDSVMRDHELSDRLEILELTSSMGLLIDLPDWDGLAGLFTDPLETDYTSLWGGTPQTTTPAELIDNWRRFRDHLDATQHLIANQVVEVEGDRASCAANVCATHLLANATGGPTWVVGGRYDFGLVRTPAGWRIGAVTLTVQWASGNQHVMTLAADQEVTAAHR